MATATSAQPAGDPNQGKPGFSCQPMVKHVQHRIHAGEKITSWFWHTHAKWDYNLSMDIFLCGKDEILYPWDQSDHT